MDISRIEEFLVLADTCNYSTASEILYTTDSTLSKHISSMEKELGCALFDRTSRKVSLTPAGTIFAQEGKQIVSLYHRVQAEIQSISNVQDDSLNIAFPDTVRQYGVLKKISDFSDQHPEINTHMIETDARYIYTMLHVGSCDFAFSARSDLFDDDIAAVPIYTDHLVLVMPKNHRFAGRDAVKMAELKGEPFAVHNKSYFENGVFIDLCQNAGFDPNIVFSSGITTNIFELIEEGKAISVLSEMRCKTYYKIDALAIAEIEPAYNFSLCLLYLKNCKFTPEMKEFYDFILS